MIYPEAASLETLQATLEPDEALVLYYVGRLPVAALVVEPTRVRIVTLGDVDRLGAMAGLEDPTRDPTPEIDTLRRRLAMPLELTAETKRVLVSPMGRLGYLPFSLLFPDREVALVPFRNHVCGTPRT